MYGKRLLSRISPENGRLTRSRGDVRWVLHGALDAALFQALAAGALPGIRLDPVPLVCSQGARGALRVAPRGHPPHGPRAGPRAMAASSGRTGSWCWAPSVALGAARNARGARVASGEAWRGGRRG